MSSGLSVTSSVMQFEYDGFCINIFCNARLMFNYLNNGIFIGHHIFIVQKMMTKNVDYPDFTRHPLKGTSPGCLKM